MSITFWLRLSCNKYSTSNVNTNTIQVHLFKFYVLFQIQIVHCQWDTHQANYNFKYRNELIRLNFSTIFAKIICQEMHLTSDPIYSRSTHLSTLVHQFRHSLSKVERRKNCFPIPRIKSLHRITLSILEQFDSTKCPIKDLLHS